MSIIQFLRILVARRLLILLAMVSVSAGALVVAKTLPPRWEASSRVMLNTIKPDPVTGLVRHLQCDLAPPAGTNWGYYCDKEMDAMFAQVRATFDPAAQTAVLQKIHEKYVDDALFLMVTHDVNARALSPKVKGFVQAQNWFQDFSPITMDK